MPVTVPTEPLKFGQPGRLAAVTALGLAGTNAHLLLSSWEGPSPKDRPGEKDVLLKDASGGEGSTPGTDPSKPVKFGEKSETGQEIRANVRPQVLFVNALSRPALIELLNRYHRMLGSLDTGRLKDVAHFSGTARRHYPLRCGIVFRDSEQAKHQIQARLKSLAQETGPSSDEPLPAASITSSMHWLFERDFLLTGEQLNSLKTLSDLASQRMGELENVYREQKGQSLTDLFQENSPLSAPSRHFIGQAAQAALWQDWGLEPDQVAGQSFGQFAAGCVAGVVSWEDALSMIAYWQSCQEQTNALDLFEKYADQFNFYPPEINLTCPLAGEPIPVHRVPGGSYWRELLEAELKGQPSSEKLEAPGDAPDPDEAMTLRFASNPASPGTAQLGNCQDSLPSGEDLTIHLLKMAAEMYEKGYPLNVGTINGAGPFRPLRLPLYPFDRKRYWITEVSEHLTHHPDQTQALEKK